MPSHVRHLHRWLLMSSAPLLASLPNCRRPGRRVGLPQVTNHRSGLLTQLAARCMAGCCSAGSSAVNHPANWGRLQLGFLPRPMRLRKSRYTLQPPLSKVLTARRCYECTPAALCFHKAPAASAALCFFDIRAQRGMVARYATHHRSLYPHLELVREHFLLTSHAGVPVAVWDRRWVSMRCIGRAWACEHDLHRVLVACQMRGCQARGGPSRRAAEAGLAIPWHRHREPQPSSPCPALHTSVAPRHMNGPVHEVERLPQDLDPDLAEWLLLTDPGDQNMPTSQALHLSATPGGCGA